MVRRCRLTLSTSCVAAPGTKRLKIKCDVPLSSSAFKLNLRRYTKAGIAARQGDIAGVESVLQEVAARGVLAPIQSYNALIATHARRGDLAAGAHTRSHFRST